jgi:hypothetical protein
MPHMTSRPRPTFTAAAAVFAILASLLLAACGGSTSTATTTTARTAGAVTSASTTPTTTSTPTTSTSTTSKGTTPAGPGRFAALRECLQKNGITLPKRTPGQAPGAGGFLGGGPTLPAGVSRAQYEAAIKKCGGLPRFPRGGFRGPRIKFNSPAIKAALVKFAACLRANGVNAPEPNTSGTGPIFNTKGLNTSSATFRTAESKCRSDLVGAFRARPGSGGAAGGPPPAG